MKAYHQGQLDFFCGIYALINALRLVCGLGLPDSRRILADALAAVSAQPLLWQATLDNETDFYWLMRYLLGKYARHHRYAFQVARLPVAPLKKNAANAAGEAGYDAPEAWLEFERPEELDLGGPHCRELHLARPASGTERERAWSLAELWPLLQGWLPSRSLLAGLGREQERRRCLILRFHRYLHPKHLPLISHWSTGLEFMRDTLMLFDCTADKNAVHSLPFKECALREDELAPERLLRLEPDSIYFIEKVQR